MKLLSLAPVLAGLVLASACSNSATRHARTPATGADGVEHRTDEFAAHLDLRERQAAWARDGWSVAIISAPITKADGSVVRKAELTRVQPQL